MPGKRQYKEKWAHVKASSTLYANNLNDKLSKSELKKNLYYFFSQYGNILEIVALKTMKMRGQAFIVFEDINDATKALKASREQNFFSKPLNISYAKTKSKITKSRERMLEQPTKKRKITHRGAKETVRILGKEIFFHLVYLTTSHVLNMFFSVENKIPILTNPTILLIFNLLVKLKVYLW